MSGRRKFLNPDPSGFAGGLNFYAYANGNPVSYLDPFGLSPNWGRVSEGVGEFGLSIVGFVLSGASEAPTLGGSTVGVVGSAYLWTQGLIDITAGWVNNPVSIPSNPGAALGSNFGPTGQDVGGVLWDLTSLKSSSADFFGSLSSGENLTQQAMKFGSFGSDAISLSSELFGGNDSGGAANNAYGSSILGNIGVGIPGINGGFGLSNPFNSTPPALSWIPSSSSQPSLSSSTGK